MQWRGAEPTLLTDRLTLRAFRMSDLAEITQIDSDPAVTYFRGFAPMNPEESEVELRKTILHRRSQKRRRLNWCVRSTSDGTFLGLTMLRTSHREWREMEIGYALAKTAWGQGFGTEATRATLAFAFDKLDAHRVIANCFPQNTASCRVLEKLGFRREAYEVESYFEHGEWQDNVRYALLEREYR
jgi:RimJ/RimL family protein N-acetyltransferase